MKGSQYFALTVGALVILSVLVILHQATREIIIDIIGSTLAKPAAIPTRCWFSLAEDVDLDCYYVYVNQDRTNEAGTIRLPVVVFRRTGNREDSVPIHFIGGGPHSALAADGMSVGNLHQRFQQLGLLKDRDVIVFDYRGLGHSSPSVHCDISDITPIGMSLDRLKKSLTACAEALRTQGVPLDSYSTESIAKDVLDIWTALELETVDVIAESYGAKVAENIMELQPDESRSFLLASPLPHTNFRWDHRQGHYIERRIWEILSLCAANVSCFEKYGNLQTKLQNTIAELESEPVSLDLETLVDDNWEKATVLVTPQMIVELLIAHTYTHDGVIRIPRLVHETATGNWTRVQDLLEKQFRMLRAQMKDWPTYYLVHCNDLGKESRSGLADEIFGSVVWRGDLSACPDSLNTGSPRQERNSSKFGGPVLVLSGGLDPITPTEWAKDFSESIPGSHLALIETATHDVLNSTCGSQLARNFFEGPAEQVFHQTKCVDIKPLEFL